MSNYGIALCRVSTSKQRLEGNSLSAQEKRIREVATTLFDTEIMKIWSLDISSRKGKNYKRVDLIEMLAYCKQNKKIKYLFVDEHDRYMRSVDEYYMWKGRFYHEVGVTLVIATKPELALSPNTASMALEFFGIWQGEANNEDRIKKVTDKMQARVEAGYFPGKPHRCYQRSLTRGLHEPLEPQWSLMKSAISKLIYDKYTLHQALRWLNDRNFSDNPKGLDLNKFKRMLTDPYYAGITKMSTWDVVGKGLHKAMITDQEHELLVQIVSGIEKKFTKQKHNPNFPMSNFVICQNCFESNRKNGRLVGYRNHNGKNPEARRYYERYMCRSCKLGLTKEDLHQQVNSVINATKLSDSARSELKEAMRIVWDRRNTDKTNVQDETNKKIDALISEKDTLVRSIGTAPELTNEIMQAVIKIKSEIESLTNSVSDTNSNDDFLKFVDFSLDYVEDLNSNWWDLTPDRRLRCEQLAFPDGIFLDRYKIVSTPTISPIYLFKTMKKEPTRTLNSYTSTYGDPKENRTPIAGMKTRFPNR